MNNYIYIKKNCIISKIKNQISEYYKFVNAIAFLTRDSIKKLFSIVQ